MSSDLKQRQQRAWRAATDFIRESDALEAVRSFRNSVPDVGAVDVSWSSGRAVGGYNELSKIVSDFVTQDIQRYTLSAEQLLVARVKTARTELLSALTNMTEV